MIKIEKTSIIGFEHAIRGMRNPKNSWDLSDSDYCMDTDCQNCDAPECPDCGYSIGKNDLKLMKTLAAGGPVHGKFMRMITVYADITAPLYWWKEFDTYKVGTVANSCSTMHTIHKRDLTIDDFSTEHLTGTSMEKLAETINTINMYRGMYERGMDEKKRKGETKEDFKLCWWQMIQLLPTSFNQKRTVMLNYEVLRNMFTYRKDHKLDEWHAFCDWIRKLSYSKLITAEIDKQ